MAKIYSISEVYVFDLTRCCFDGAKTSHKPAYVGTMFVYSSRLHKPVGTLLYHKLDGGPRTSFQLQSINETNALAKLFVPIWHFCPRSSVSARAPRQHTN